ncbi:alpha/beta hydrolase [Mycobacterium asiaticum]|uniref:alpha/beta hydrolase n=1 Tax=Mycobacterium asiaticum TaxID=1790 RepID=UPI0007F01FD9|nr:alpha/beta fold hydrolase [Mycobacterium asiaticum]OBK96186.1 alpha/beta hydrolase [Mycobacterium asiaticum]
MWLHADSWQPWMDLFARHGYDVVAPGWPNEPATVAEAREHPERVANLGIDAVVQHFAAIAAALPEPPVVIGHSFGGLIAQKLLDLGYARAAVAIDPAQIKGVKPLPLAQLRSSFPVLGNPASKKRAVSLTAKQFRYGFGNAIDWAESDALYDRYTIPSPARPLFQTASANFHRNSPAKVNTANASRGPLLFISGQQDHTVPDVVTRAAYKLYGDSTAVTELKQYADRGHSLVVDNGWREIADDVLGWLARQRIGSVNDGVQQSH